MRVFSRPFPIERLSLEARLLYTGFLGFLLVGLATSAWLYRDSFGGLGAADASRYFLGEEAALAKLPPGGPALELPEEEPAHLTLEKSERQVMETFHFHLFTVPVVLLIVGHLFMLTALSTRRKAAVIVFATLATLLHLLAPLLVRFGGASFGGLMPLSALLAALGWLPMCAWPLWEMWRPRAVEEPEP